MSTVGWKTSAGFTQQGTQSSMISLCQGTSRSTRSYIRCCTRMRFCHTRELVRKALTLFPPRLKQFWIRKHRALILRADFTRARAPGLFAAQDQIKSSKAILLTTVMLTHQARETSGRLRMLGRTVNLQTKSAPIASKTSTIVRCPVNGTAHFLRTLSLALA